MTQPPPMEVLPEDREAAAMHAENGLGMGEVAERIRAGSHDQHELIQAFARHRQQAQRAPTSAEGLRAVERYLDARKYAEDDARVDLDLHDVSCTVGDLRRLAAVAAITRNIVDCYGVGGTPEQFCKNVADFMEQARALLAREDGKL